MNFNIHTFKTSSSRQRPAKTYDIDTNYAVCLNYIFLGDLTIKIYA
jgi:hypothetical protein